MGLLTHFIQGGALAELLIEGHNPYAHEKLRAADVDALRQQVFTTESLQAFASGRIVGAGRGIWALTSQALLLRNDSEAGVLRLALSELRGFEAVRGRYGHTLRLQTADRQWSLFGVDRDLAQGLHQALQAAGIRSQFDDRVARSAAWREAAPAGWSQECLNDLRSRLAMA